MRYNTTSLRPSTRSRIIDRDYLAHVLKWSYAVRLVERRGFDIPRTYRILDAGCGVEAPLLQAICGHAYLARGRPIEYVGVDVGPIRVPSVPRWATLLEETDLTSWDPPHLFDLVVCFEVIEHMDRLDGIRLLQTLRRSVDPNGVVLLATPVKGRTLPRNHVYEWDLSDLEGACLDSGLETVKKFGTFMDVQRAVRLSLQDDALRRTMERLREYYSNEVLSCLYAPLFPDDASSVLLVLRPMGG